MYTVVLVLIGHILKETTSNQYAFGVFENSKGLKDIFNFEISLVESLRNTREILSERRNFLQNLENSSHILSPNLLNLQMSSVNHIDPFHYDGASRGLLVLLDTYKFDLRGMLQGIVRDQSLSIELLGKERLTLQDLLHLSKKTRIEEAKRIVDITHDQAFDYNWYDSSIALLRVYLKAHSDPSTDSYRKNFKVYPYMIDSQTLQKKKKQPKVIGKTTFYNRNVSHIPPPAQLDVQKLKESELAMIEFTDLAEEEFRRICREEISPPESSERKCILLHHNDPYLRLGPFKQEIISEDPPRMILVDFFTDEEMDFLKKKSYPSLSTARTKEIPKKEIKKKKRNRIVQKSVQHWLKDIKFNQEYNLQILRGELNKFDPSFPDWYKEKEPEDIYGFQIVHPILYRLSLKIEHATRLKVTDRWSSSAYQVTNYGLGGLCELHIDPHGMLRGTMVNDDRVSLFKTGDMILTLMGWLDDVEAGGSTAFIYPGREGILKPRKGSAAIWFNLHKKWEKKVFPRPMGDVPSLEERNGF
ncbi:P4HA [Lepeophtheirus salmonis]|uniref:P4HA n=1 Tax=Lepeophtheirus salmonis TaxID=72036 RepID=A0A7R8CIK1_LEPSM|nr:P4HA [Lepeophtheirus salmonis]CAF2833287.1 P4HA [Lepeophtheirus salmonis]